MTLPEQEIDARGLRCPLPVIRMEAALRRMAPGAGLTIIADDPVAVLDLPHFAREGGHKIERLDQLEGEIGGDICVFMVTRGENP